ncbi:MAG: Bifunctional protein HldE [candidate division CPR1 bacterium ADurb.Bin160]|uniref:Bifunctional protein HldE n=1 Tax=candidate division CPR1 bacterium ADurb.Bin160 TaxID=1852826 RepID=A0A1V5ZPU4_9BACT|nr:MAG: Bifunctional protein HldE [candidate division CPR1 bacterium ADurb.Bin160]
MNKSENGILVIGDLMIDRYIYGSVNRVSQEAPVPILNFEKENIVFGGAGNVLFNLYNIGCFPFFLSVSGLEYRNFINEQIKKMTTDYFLLPDVLLKNEPCTTTVKNRYIGNGKQILRVDHEKIQDFDFLKYDTGKKIFNFFRDKEIKIIIVSDYGKGLITENFWTTVILPLKKKLNCKIVVDPVPKNWEIYNECFLIKPNEKEFDSIHEKYNILSSPENKFEYILRTEGPKGMTLFESNTIEQIYRYVPETKNVVDIIGAGDVVISALSYCLLKKMSLEESIFIANKCASLAISRQGTSFITKQEFECFLEKTEF